MLNAHALTRFLKDQASQNPAQEQLARDIGAHFVRCLEGLPGQLADRNFDGGMAAALIGEIAGRPPSAIEQAATRDPFPRDPWSSLALYHALFLESGPVVAAISAHLAGEQGLNQTFADNTVKILALKADRLAATMYGEGEGRDADDQARLDLDEAISAEWRKACGDWRPDKLGIFADLVLRILFEAFRFTSWSLRCQHPASIRIADDLARSLGSFIPLGEHHEHEGTWIVLVRRVTPAPSPTLPST